MQIVESKESRPAWVKGGLGAFKILPILAGMLTCVNMIPATNGTWLYALVFTDANLKWAQTSMER